MSFPEIDIYLRIRKKEEWKRAEKASSHVLEENLHEVGLLATSV